jgi:hypothetical protein
LDNLLRGFFGLVLRVVLLFAGVIFFVGLLFAACVLLAIWLVRALWARLTGRPVTPWTFQVNRQAMWNRFYRAPGSQPGSQAQRRNDSDVIDVEPKEIKHSDR